MNIGLVGYFGSGNYGDELFVELFRRSFAGHELTVLHASASTGKHDEAEVMRQDAIIIGGGDLLITSSYVDRYWDPTLLKRPVFVSGVGVDFRRRQDDAVVARLASFLEHQSVRDVTAREERSRQWIAQNLNPRCVPRIHSDLVAALPFARVPSLIPTLGVVLRANEPIDRGGLSALIAAARQNGYVVKTIILGTGHTAGEDSQAATAALQTDGDLVVRSSIDELSAEISSCDIVASQRFHGCLASMLMGIPTIGLLTTEKFSALFNEVDRGEYLIPLDDPLLVDIATRPPAPVSPVDIARLRASAKGAVDALHRAVLAAGRFPQSRRGGYPYGPYGPHRDAFLDGRIDRTARWQELSPRLRADTNACLDPREELAWYRNEIRKRKGYDYLATLDRLIDWTAELRSMDPNTRAVVAIPVAGTAEHDHIYGTLSLYAQQDPAMLADTVVLTYINYPADARQDAERGAQLDSTLHQVESARQDFPQLNLATVVESFDPDLPSRHRGIIGYVGRRVYDLAMMSVERADVGDVLLIRNDADAIGMSRRYLERLLTAASEHPETDIFQGGMRWGTHRYRDYPGYGIVMAFKEALRALTLRPGALYRSKPGTNGSNVAIRMASLAAVGGVGNSDYYGAGGDDVEIGLRIHAARHGAMTAAPGAVAMRRPIRFVADAQIDASGERPLQTYRSGQSIVETWDTYNHGPGGYTPRTQQPVGLLMGPERFDSSATVDRMERNFNALSQGWYTDRDLVDTALRCVIGGHDTDGQAVYDLTSNGNRTVIEFTPAGRRWIGHRLRKTRRGDEAPYGRRLRKALYGETGSKPSRSARMVSAIR